MNYSHCKQNKRKQNKTPTTTNNNSKLLIIKLHGSSSMLHNRRILCAPCRLYLISVSKPLSCRHFISPFCRRANWDPRGAVLIGVRSPGEPGPDASLEAPPTLSLGFPICKMSWGNFITPKGLHRSDVLGRLNLTLLGS